MVREQFVGTSDEVGELRREIPLGQIAAYLLSADVVGGRELHVRAAVRDDEAVAVAHSGIECEAVGAEFASEIFDEFARFGRGDLACGIVLHRLFGEVLLVRKRDQVHPDRNVVLFHVYAYRKGFQRRTPGVTRGRVVAQRAEIRHVAARIVTVGDGLDQPHSARLCEHIHARFVCNFQRSASAEGGDGIVTHTVAENKSVFHNHLRDMLLPRTRFVNLLRTPNILKRLQKSYF